MALGIQFEWAGKKQREGIVSRRILSNKYESRLDRQSQRFHRPIIRVKYRPPSFPPSFPTRFRDMTNKVLIKPYNIAVSMWLSAQTRKSYFQFCYVKPHGTFIVHLGVHYKS